MTARIRTLSLLLVLAGCKASLGEMATHAVQVPASSDLRLIQIQLPVSESFTVRGGGTQAVTGTIRTNVPVLAPRFSEDGKARKIVQRLPSGQTLPEGARNEWNLQLGTTTPLLLDIGAGVLKGDLSLGDLQLVGLNLGVGVDAPTIHFDAPNRIPMQEITINAGAGQFRLSGLSHAAPRKLKVDGGAGAMDLDFAGTLKQTVTAEIKGGVGAVTLTIPKTVPARLRVETGIGAITAPGYTVNGETYTSPGFTEDRPHWEMTLKIGVGAVTVRTN